MIATPLHLESVLQRMDYGRSLKQELLMADRPPLQVPYAQPLLDAVELFERLKIDYALIGGIASMCYGQSRFTEDVDFIAMTGHMDVLSANPSVMQEMHFSPDCVTRLYHQSGVGVDVRNDEFADQISQGASDATLARRTVKVIEPHDLIAMKLRIRRIKDDYDISQIVVTTTVDEQKLANLTDAEGMAHFQQIKLRAT